MATLFLLPLLTIFVSTWFALGFVVDFPVVAIPVLIGAWHRAETRQAVASLPCYFARRLANCWFMFRAMGARVLFTRPPEGETGRRKPTPAALRRLPRSRASPRRGL